MSALIKYQVTSIFGYVTLSTVQNYHLRHVCTILSDSERIYYLSDNFAISSYVVSKPHDSL